jgi:uncharacterized phage protein (TIGR02218 family)
MTRYISPSDLLYLAGNELALCKCVKMTLRSGTVLGFTDHDADLSISAVTYRSKVGLSVGNIRWSNQLDNEPTELRGLFSSETGGLTEANARAGLYNQALVEMYLVRWDTAAIITHLKRGYLQELNPQGAGYSALVRSLADPLAKKKLLRVINRLCDADLGDARCAKAVLSFNGTANGSGSLTEITYGLGDFTGPVTASDITGGKIILTSGDYTWHKNQIKEWDSGSLTIHLVKPLPAALVNGTTFTAYEGCDKKASTCKDRFNNLVRFRGFPHVPDRDNLAFKIYPDNNHGGYQAGTGEGT